MHSCCGMLQFGGGGSTPFLVSADTHISPTLLEMAQSKRKFRAEDQVDSGSKAAKRQRKKGRPAVRRLCRTMCFKPPEITEQDKLWEDDFAPGLVSTSTNQAVEAPQKPAKRRRVDTETKQQAAQPTGHAAVQMYLSRRCMQDPTPLQARRVLDSASKALLASAKDAVHALSVLIKHAKQGLAAAASW